MTTAPASASLRSTQLLELQAWIDATPQGATIKGMYVEGFLKAFDQKQLLRPTNARYTAFKDYPLASFMQLMLDSTEELFPRLSPREALRAQGRLVYPTLAQSTAGRIIFAMAGNRFEAALPLASRGWSMSLSPGKVQAREVCNGSAMFGTSPIATNSV